MGIFEKSPECYRLTECYRPQKKQKTLPQNQYPQDKVKQEIFDEEKPSTSAVGDTESGEEGQGVQEVEMVLHCTPNSDSVLQDLVLNHDLSDHVTNTPVNIPALLADNPDIRGHVMMSLSKQILTHQEFIKKFLQKHPEGFIKFLQSYQ